MEEECISDIEESLINIEQYIKTYQNNITAFCSYIELQNYDWESFEKTNITNYTIEDTSFRINYTLEPILLPKSR